MKSIKLALFALLVIVFASCQKEIDPTINEPEEPRKYLSRVVETESGTPGESWLLEFKYDAQKRCTSMVEKYIDSTGGVPTVLEEYTYTFHYNGAESRPFKITSDIFGAGVSWFTKFDSQGKKLQDSLHEPGSGYTEIVDYSYSGNRIIARYSVDILGSTLNFLDTIYHDGNNVTKEVSAEYSLGTLSHWSEYTYTYDNRPNPFNQLNINTAFFASSSYLGFGTFVGLNKNNYTSDTYRDLFPVAGSPSTVQYQYTYDADGYPVTVRYVDGSTTGAIRYEY
jgi:hypothetical protein